MNGKQVTSLAAQLAAGVVTADYIRDKYGSSVLTTVLGVAAGIGVGSVAGVVAEELYDTPIVGDVVSVVAEPVADVVNSILDIF